MAKRQSTESPESPEVEGTPEDNSAQDSVEETPAETPAEDSAPELDEDDMIFVNKIIGVFNRHNEVANKEKANSDDMVTVIEAVKSDTSDANVATWAEQIEALRSQAEDLDTQLTKYATDIARERVTNKASAEELEALSIERKKLHKKAVNLRDLLRDEHGKGVDKLLPELVTLKGSGTSTGRRSLRGFTVTVNGDTVTLPQTDKDGVTTKVSSFAAAAQKIGCETSQLSGEYMRLAGTDESDKFVVGKTFEWTVTQGDKSYEVTATKN